MGWTLFSLYFLDWEWKCSFGRECFCSSVSLSVFFLGFCSSVLEDGMRWVCIYDRLLPPHNPLLELQHTMHARMELVEWHMHFRWRCIRLHSILQLQGKEFSMAPNFPQRVDMGRNLCGGPVTLVCLKGPRHGSSISTRSSSSPPSYHRWGERSSATMASTCLSLCLHASSPSPSSSSSSSSPGPRRSSLAFSSSSKSKRMLKVRAKALREDWRQKSKPIPPGAVYPAKDYCRYVLCFAVHSFVCWCDYVMRCLSLFLFLLLYGDPSRCGLCDTYYVAHVKTACAFLGDGMSRVEVTSFIFTSPT